MNAPRRDHARVAGPSRACPSGFTLLELLVSLGIIVAALSGIAALLPATGLRLGEATELDRAGTMAANARADLITRGLARADLWPTTASGSTRAVVFGEGLTTNSAALTLAGAGDTISLANNAAIVARIDPATGFRLRDHLQGSLSGVCYGCMLSTTAAPPPMRGSTARMSTVVFRRPAAAVQAFVLSQSGSGNSPVFRVTGTVAPSGTEVPIADADLAAALRKQFLAGCSSALAVTGPGQPPREPRWVPIAASWTMTGVATGSSFVTLSGTDHLALMSGGSLRVFGFEGLLRVDERFVTLE